MAQEWAKSFYKNHAWLHNRKAYLNALVDLDGHIVKADEDGYYWIDEYGYHVRVSSDNIVPPRMCERCYSMGKLVPANVVHHKTWITQENIGDPHITLSFDNFQRLCQDCHAVVHKRQEESRVAFDAYGNVVWKEDQA